MMQGKKPAKIAFGPERLQPANSSRLVTQLDKAKI